MFDYMCMYEYVWVDEKVFSGGELVLMMMGTSGGKSVSVPVFFFAPKKVFGVLGSA